MTYIPPNIQDEKFLIDATEYNKVTVDNILRLKEFYDKRDDWFLVRHWGVVSLTDSTWSRLPWIQIDDAKSIVNSSANSPDYTINLNNGVYRIRALSHFETRVDGYANWRVRNVTSNDTLIGGMGGSSLGNDGSDYGNIVVPMIGEFVIDEVSGNADIAFEYYFNWQTSGTLGRNFLPSPVVSTDQENFTAKIWRLP